MGWQQGALHQSAPGGGPLPPGHLPHGGTDMQRSSGIPQVAPGCWNPTPASSLLNGLGASVGGHMPVAQQQVPLMGRPQVESSSSFFTGPSHFSGGVAPAGQPAVYAPSHAIPVVG